MPRGPRHSGSSSTTTLTISPTINNTTTFSSGSQYLHNTSYGLLEPVKPSLSVRPPPTRPSLHHRRKSSSSSSSPVWSDKGFDFAELKERSVDIGEKISETVPGVRYSAAFISTLRANLALSTSLAPQSPSPFATTPGLPPSTKSIPSNGRSMAATTKDPDPLAGIPPLTFERPQSEEERTAGLKLVADTITQQKSRASIILIYSPITLGIWTTLVAIAYALTVKSRGDLPVLFTTAMGLLMVMLAGIRYVVRPYDQLVDKVNWDWLGDDEMMVARFGEDIIGSCVFRVEPPLGKKKSHNGSSSSNGTRRALIRAWTVRRRERGRGIGTGLLEKVIDLAKEKGCEGVEFAPADDMVGTDRVLPDYEGFGGYLKLNAEFDKKDAQAKDFLKSLVREKIPEKRRRGSR